MEEKADAMPVQDAPVTAPSEEGRESSQKPRNMSNAEERGVEAAEVGQGFDDAITKSQTASQSGRTSPVQQSKTEPSSQTTLEPPSDDTKVKLEPSSQPPYHNTLSSFPQRASSENHDTITAGEEMKLRGSKLKEEVTNEEQETDAKPAPSQSKSKKKGMARKPSAKKQKVEPKNAKKKSSPAPSVQSTTSTSKPRVKSIGGLNRSNSKSGTPFNSSPAPAGSSDDSDNESGVSDSGSDTIYCICRKPDNHSWMIACDGGCDDWFHGKCVNMREADGPLIDRYICPNCAKTSDIVTTWKPMCRFEGCRNPARLSKSAPSKYCSDECGVRFMQAMTRRAVKATSSPQKRGQGKKKRGIHTEGAVRSDEDDETGPRGGPLRLSQLKALAAGITRASDFRSLGSTAIPTTIDQSLAYNEEALTETDKSRITQIASEKALLRERMSSLKDREKFIASTKEQVTKYAEKENIKPGNICGFDSRLAWSTEELAKHNAAQTNGTQEQNETKDEWEYFCARKRCDKHKQWQKIQLSDVRFDEAELADRMRALDREEGDVRERAVLRFMQAGVGGGGMGNSVEILAA